VTPAEDGAAEMARRGRGHGLRRRRDSWRGWGRGGGVSEKPNGQVNASLAPTLAWR
jgi:hypothetical protein